MTNDEITWAYLKNKFLRVCRQKYAKNEGKIKTALTISFVSGIAILSMLGMLEKAIRFFGFVMYKFFELSFQLVLASLIGAIGLCFLAIAIGIIVLIILCVKEFYKSVKDVITA